MEIVILSILLFAAHISWAANRLLDLFTKSRRKNKVRWMLFILLVPVIGALSYNMTRKRLRLSR